MKKDACDIIEKEYPFPIAYRYQVMLREQNPHRKFLCMLDVFEITIRYLALIVIAHHAHNTNAIKEIDRLHVEKLLRKISLGDWVLLLQQSIRFYWQEKQHMFIKELLSVYTEEAEQFKLSEPVRMFEQFVSLRNSYKGHGVVEEESTYAQLYAEWQPKLSEILQKFSCLTKYLLIVPAVGDGKIDCVLYRGCEPTLWDDNLDFAKKDTAHFEETVWLVDPQSRESLELWPFIVFVLGKTDVIYLYDAAQVQKNREMRSIKYISFQTSIAPLTYRKGESGREAIVWFNQYFYKKCHELQIDVGTQVEKPRLYFDSIQADIEFHTKNFVGRDTVVETMESFCQQHSCGYIVIYGIPGQGKSAFSSHLVKQYGFIHHFIKQGGIRSNVSRFMQSLIEQLQEKYHIYYPIPNGEVEIIDYFASLLHQISKDYLVPKEQTEVIILDALDELSGDDREKLHFLPHYLPRNVYIILTSRPMQSIKYYNFQVPHHEHTLEPLNPKEIALLFSKNFQELDDNTLQQVTQISQGNPLYLRLLLEESKWELDITKLPTGIESLFEKILNRIKKDNLADDMFQILCVLCIANKGLNISELSEILQIKRRKVKRLLENLQPFLIDRNGDLSIFHLQFQHYLLEEEFEKDEIEEAHNLIISYCLPWEEKKLSYGYDFLIQHYLQIKNYNSIFELLESDFLSKKALYYQSWEFCLPDLRLGFEAALATNQSSEILHYGLLYTLTAKELSQRIERGQFIASGIEGNFEIALREIAGVSESKTRCLAFIALAEVYLRMQQIEKAREVLEKVFTQEMLHLHTQELHWFSQFVSKWVITIDQGLALRLLKLMQSDSILKQGELDSQKLLNLKNIVDSVLLFANYSPKKIDTLMLAFSITEGFRQLDRREVEGPWPIVVNECMGIHPEKFVTEAKLQQDIAMQLLALDVECCCAVVDEIRHPCYRALVYYFLAEKTSNQNQYYQKYSEILSSLDAIGQAFLYLQIMEKLPDYEKRKEFYQKCQHCISNINDSEQLSMLLFRFLPVLGKDSLEEAEPLLSKIDKDYIRLRTIARIGKNIFATHPTKSKEFLLQAMDDICSVGFAQYRLFVIEEVAVTLQQQFDEEIFQKALQIIDGIPLVREQCEALLVLLTNIDPKLEEIQNLWEKTWEKIVHIERNWEKTDLCEKFFKVLSLSNDHMWTMFISKVYPQLKSIYLRSMALIENHFKRNIPYQTLLQTCNNDKNLSQTSQAIVYSWLAAHTNSQVRDQYITKTEEALLGLSAEEKDFALEKAGKNLAHVTPNKVIDFLCQISSEITRSLSTMRILPHLQKVDCEQFSRLLDSWQANFPIHGQMIPEIYGEMVKYIYKYFEEEERTNLQQKLFSTVENLNEYMDTLSLVHVAKSLIPFDRTQAEALLQKIEIFVIQENISSNDWRNFEHYREKIWATMIDIYREIDLEKAELSGQKIDLHYDFYICLAWYAAPEKKVSLIEKILEFVPRLQEPINRAVALAQAARLYAQIDMDNAKKYRNRASLEAEREEELEEATRVLLRVVMITRSIDEKWAQNRFHEVLEKFSKLYSKNPQETDQLVLDCLHAFQENPSEWSAQKNGKWADWLLVIVDLMKNPKFKRRAIEQILNYLPKQQQKLYATKLLAMAIVQEEAFLYVFTQLFNDIEQIQTLESALQKAITKSLDSQK